MGYVPGNTVGLSFEFYDSNNQPYDLAALPTVKVTQADGTVLQTATNMTHTVLGVYLLEYTIPSNQPAGTLTFTATGTSSTGNPIVRSLNLEVIMADSGA
jgi:uncharacterized protein YfaS (alpha-2-macroglobulin family)